MRTRNWQGSAARLLVHPRVIRLPPYGTVIHHAAHSDQDGSVLSDCTPQKLKPPSKSNAATFPGTPIASRVLITLQVLCC